MRPFIRNGDYILIKPCFLEDTKVGDVVAVGFHFADKRLCVHRLIWKDFYQRRLVLKGDSLSYIERMKSEKFSGKVVSIIRNNKMFSVENHLTNFLKLFVSLCLIPWQITRRH